MTNKLIGICGDSGSGKSELIKLIIKSFEQFSDNLLYYECDRYHKWERTNKNWNIYTHLNPISNDLDKMYLDILSLKQNKSIDVRDYDHFTGNFTEKAIILPKKIIIVSGLHTLYKEELTNIYNLAIYVEPEENLRILWKIRRDVKERKYDISTIKNKIFMRSYDRENYILPQKNNADIIIKYIPYKEINLENINHENILEYDSDFYILLFIEKKELRELLYKKFLEENCNSILFEKNDKKFIELLKYIILNS
jgi:uridine kinase